MQEVGRKEESGRGEKGKEGEEEQEEGADV